MPTSAPGNNQRCRTRGFTLIEVMVVMAVIAVAIGLVSISIRDPAGTHLEQDAARLAALLESARAEARAGGFEAVWVPNTEVEGESFHFVGLPTALSLPTRWLDPAVSAQVVGGTSVRLGPDAILPPQRILLRLENQRLEVASDGIAAFAVVPPAAEPS